MVFDTYIAAEKQLEQKPASYSASFFRAACGRSFKRDPWNLLKR